MARKTSHEFIETFGALSRAIRAVAAESYATFGVGSAQAKFLRYIGRHSRISQAELARATQTAPTLTGRALEPLVARGWVRRKRSKEDRREYILELTASGKKMRKRVEDARLRVAERIVAVLAERDLEDFDRVAKKLLAEFGDPNAA